MQSAMLLSGKRYVVLLNFMDNPLMAWLLLQDSFIFLYKRVDLKLYRLLICDFNINDIATVLTDVSGGRPLPVSSSSLPLIQSVYRARHAACQFNMLHSCLIVCWKGRSMVIGWRKNSWNPERVPPVVTFDSVCPSVCLSVYPLAGYRSHLLI